MEVAERQFEVLREQIVERRQELGLSKSELARKIGVSPSMVSQIERGNSLPSVPTLFALATALGANVDTFFVADPAVAASAPRRTTALPEDPTRQSPTAEETRDDVLRSDQYLVRKDDRALIDISGGVRWERLTPHPLADVEFLELKYEPHAQSNESPYRHPGFELVVVLEGRFEISVGFEKYVLEPGDSIAFPSSLPHRYCNPLDRESRAITTILRDPPVETGGRGA